MDVKSTFLNGFKSEKVYLKQPPSFENLDKPIYLFKPTKTLYGLKQALGDWYKKLSKFLVVNDFTRRKVDITFLH